MTPQQLQLLLRQKRFLLTTEKLVQAQIEAVLKENSVDHIREYDLFKDRHSIIDFFVAPHTGVEVKIGGGRRDIYRQLERYCQSPELKALLLVTNKAMGLPHTINGVECFILNLSSAWL